MSDHGYFNENWDEVAHHGRDVYAPRTDWGTRKMSQKLNLEKALKEAQRAQANVEKLLKSMQRFPEEFEVGTVLKFKHTFTSYTAGSRKKYDYVALRADNGFWYLTCAGSKTMTWENLVEFIGDENVTVMVDGETL
jgi:hypothetical protein